MKLGTTEISALYLGSNEIKKAYLGTNKVYEKISEIYFNTLISPTTWTEVTAKKEYTATDTLGTWTIKAEDSYNTNYIPPQAFDNVITNTNMWRSTALTNNATYTYLEITCPVNIKPISLMVAQRYCGTTSYPSYLQAYNEDTSTWDNLGTLARYTATTSQTFAISTNNYYKKFRVYVSRYSSSQNTPIINEFQINEGYYKP